MVFFAVPDLLTNYEREPKGVPIGRAPTVNLRNNHTQYIFTWYVTYCSSERLC
jgi:surfeit locus 1 family protein